jgi:hypothetical protein
MGKTHCMMLHSQPAWSSRYSQPNLYNSHWHGLTNRSPPQLKIPQR